MLDALIIETAEVEGFEARECRPNVLDALIIETPLRADPDLSVAERARCVDHRDKSSSAAHPTTDLLICVSD